MSMSTTTLPTFSEARARLLADIAARTGKPVDELRGWEDYDPITVDEEAYHMCRGHSGVRWAGD
jgi:hypothetical protein